MTMMIDDTYGILYVNCNYNFLDIIKNSSLNNHSSIQRKKHHISSMIIMMIDDAACDIFYVDCTYNFLDIINNSSSDNHSSIWRNESWGWWVLYQAKRLKIWIEEYKFWLRMSNYQARTEHKNSLLWACYLLMSSSPTTWRGIQWVHQTWNARKMYFISVLELCGDDFDLNIE